MTDAALWVLLAILGCVCLAGVQFVEWAWLKATLVRAAGLLFITGGLVQAGGLLGDTLDGLVDGVLKLANQTGTAVVGTTIVVGALVAVLCAAWLLGMLPQKVSRMDPADWLMVSGLFLPALARSIPGPIGEAFRNLFDAIHDLVAPYVVGWFS